MVDDQEIDVLIEQAQQAQDFVVTHRNEGLSIWTGRVLSAMTFIPRLIATIHALRHELAVSRLHEGGHLDTTFSATETRTVCSTCGTVVEHSDLRQAVRTPEVEASLRYTI